MPDDLWNALKVRAGEEGLESVTQLVIRFCQQGLESPIPTGEGTEKGTDLEALIKSLRDEVEALKPLHYEVESIKSELGKSAA